MYYTMPFNYVGHLYLFFKNFTTECDRCSANARQLLKYAHMHLILFLHAYRSAAAQPRLLIPVALVMMYNRWNE